MSKREMTSTPSHHRTQSAVDNSNNVPGKCRDIGAIRSRQLAQSREIPPMCPGARRVHEILDLLNRRQRDVHGQRPNFAVVLE